jgi:hypothetical protein
VTVLENIGPERFDDPTLCVGCLVGGDKNDKGRAEIRKYGCYIAPSTTI